mgnify:CR=1 FL=1
MDEALTGIAVHPNAFGRSPWLRPTGRACVSNDGAFRAPDLVVEVKAILRAWRREVVRARMMERGWRMSVFS